MFGRRKIKNEKIVWEYAPDIKKRFEEISKKIDFGYIQTKDLYFCRSRFSKARAYARIWGLGRIWQLTLDLKPSYIIEVISEKFDKLSEKEKDKVILHEITHIPKNFSGSLVPHTRKRGPRNFNSKVDKIFKLLYKF